MKKTSQSKRGAAVEDATTSSVAELETGVLDEMIGIVLQRTFNTAYSYFNTYMGKDFKPGFFSTLYLLRQNPGISQNELAASIRRDKSTLVPFLNKMENLGWIVREQCEHDRRTHELYLTPQGKKMAKVFEKKVRSLEDKLAAELGRERTKELLHLLRTLDTVFSKI